MRGRYNHHARGAIKHEFGCHSLANKTAARGGVTKKKTGTPLVDERGGAVLLGDEEKRWVAILFAPAIGRCRVLFLANGIYCARALLSAAGGVLAFRCGALFPAASGARLGSPKVCLFVCGVPV